MRAIRDYKARVELLPLVMIIFVVVVKQIFVTIRKYTNRDFSNSMKTIFVLFS